MSILLKVLAFLYLFPVVIGGIIAFICVKYKDNETLNDLICGCDWGLDDFDIMASINSPKQLFQSCIFTLIPLFNWFVFFFGHMIFIIYIICHYISEYGSSWIDKLFNKDDQ